MVPVDGIIDDTTVIDSYPSRSSTHFFLVVLLLKAKGKNAAVVALSELIMALFKHTAP